MPGLSICLPSPSWPGSRGGSSLLLPDGRYSFRLLRGEGRPHGAAGQQPPVSQPGPTIASSPLSSSSLGSLPQNRSLFGGDFIALNASCALGPSSCRLTPWQSCGPAVWDGESHSYALSTPLPSAPQAGICPVCQHGGHPAHGNLRVLPAAAASQILPAPLPGSEGKQTRMLLRLALRHPISIPRPCWSGRQGLLSTTWSLAVCWG